MKELKKFVINKIFRNLDESFPHEEELIIKKFFFKGKKVACEKDYPHVPHAVKMYTTVSGDTLEEFCLGWEGKTTDNCQLIIWIQKFLPPDKNFNYERVQGYYIMLPLRLLVVSKPEQGKEE